MTIAKIEVIGAMPQEIDVLLRDMAGTESKTLGAGKGARTYSYGTLYTRLCTRCSSQTLDVPLVGAAGQFLGGGRVAVPIPHAAVDIATASASTANRSSWYMVLSAHVARAHRPFQAIQLHLSSWILDRVVSPHIILAFFLAARDLLTA